MRGKKKNGRIGDQSSRQSARLKRGEGSSSIDFKCGPHEVYGRGGDTQAILEKKHKEKTSHGGGGEDTNKFI